MVQRTSLRDQNIHDLMPHNDGPHKLQPYQPTTAHPRFRPQNTGKILYPLLKVK